MRRSRFGPEQSGIAPPDPLGGLFHPGSRLHDGAVILRGDRTLRTEVLRRLAMNFVVPYLVSSYSSARAALALEAQR